jgi:hypothetical protein
LETGSNADRKPIKVAIIDSGIDTTVYDLSGYVKKAVGFRVN